MKIPALYLVAYVSCLSQFSCGKRELTASTRLTSQTSAQTDNIQPIDDGSKKDEKTDVPKYSLYQLSGPLECCSFKNEAVFLRQCSDFDPLVCNKMTK
jgi:hypothetical protein